MKLTPCYFIARTGDFLNEVIHVKIHPQRAYLEK